jgi:fermentation-respiration switch protein FrsA (DUF1100 family)
LFLILAISTFIGFAGILVWPHHKAPVDRRRVLRWVASGGLLFSSSNLLSQIASQQDWTLHHSALGAAVLLMDLAVLPCLAKALFSLWRWRRRARRQEV